MREKWVFGSRAMPSKRASARQSARVRRAIYSIETLELRVLLSDVAVAAVAKSVNYSQVGTGAPTLDDYRFDTLVIETAANTVGSATVTPPGRSTSALTARFDDGVNQLAFQSNDYSTQAAMDAAYPDGTYQLAVNAVQDGSHTLTLNETGDEYSAAPHITNYDTLSGADPAQAIAVTWNPMSNGTANDYIQLGVSDDTGGVYGNVVFESPLPGFAGALTGTATGSIIPAGTLQAGHQYQVWLEFIKFASKDTTDYPGVVAGGVYQSGGDVDFTTGAASTADWVADAPIGTARDQFAAGVVDGKVYIFGGNAFGTGHNLNSTEMFDPTTGAWSNVADDDNYGGQGTEELTGASVNGKFYAISGYGGLNWVEEYDPATNTWTSKAPNPAPVAGATSAVYNGEIYLFGGYNESTGTQIRSDAVEAYNPTTNSWRTVTTMPQTLQGESVAVVGNSVYVIGGATLDASGNPTTANTDVSRYDFLTNTWTTTGLAPIPSLNVGSYDAAAPVIDGKIYIVGGITATIVDGALNVSTLDSVEIYDTTTNIWSTGPSLPAPRNGEGVVAVGNTIYAIGGNTGSYLDDPSDPDDPSDSYGIVSNVWSWQVSANLAPSSIAGDSLVVLKTSLGVGNNTNPGIDRLTFPTSGNTFAFEKEIFPEDDRAINYSYTVTGPSTASIVDVADNVTVELTFDTATSGTANYIFTTGGNYNAAFTLFTPPVQNFAPASIAGNTATLNVAGGESDRFTTSGTTNIIFNSDGTFNVIVDGTPEASGATSYTQAVGSGLDIAEIVNADNNGQTTYVYFVFTSTTGGSFYLTDANDSNGLTDFSYGTFNLSTPQRAPNSIAGDSLVIAGTQSQPNGFARLTFADSGNTSTEEDFLHTPAGQTEIGNYSYTVTGPSTATISDTTDDVTLELTFTTATSGTCFFMNPTPGDGGNGNALFTLFTPPLQNLAPSSVAGTTATLNFAGGGGTEFNTSGTETVSLGSDGTFTGFFDGSVESTGIYSYTQAIGSVPGIAEIVATHNDATYVYLIFTSVTGGSFYQTDANESNNLSDFSYGTFNLGTLQLAPTSIAGDAMVNSETAGTDENTPPDFSRFVFSASGNTFTNEDFIYGEDGTQGYSYMVTGPSSATLVGTTNNVSDLLTFTTPTTGTFYQITPEGVQDGMFTLFMPPLQNLAPASIAATTVTLNFGGGGGTELNSSGTETISLGSDGTFTGFYNGSLESSGTYSYTQAIGSVPGIAEAVAATYNHTSYNYLVFTSATGGSFYETDANDSNGLTDFSYGTFSISSSAHLAFEQTPVGVTAGSIIDPAINVDVDDGDGNIVAADDSIVTLSIVSGPAGANLSGTLSMEDVNDDVNGVATFSDLSLDTPGDYTLLATDGSMASATISFTVADPPGVSAGDGAVYSISTPANNPQTLTVTAGVVTLNNDLAYLFSNGILSIGPGAEVITTSPQSIGGLVISPGGKLDLTNAFLFIQYGNSPDPTSTIAGYISSAFDSGQWDSPGLTSSTAANSAYVVGYSDDTVDHELYVQYTLAGDFNLDGTVNSCDFDALAANFGKSGEDFVGGDSNYDGVVNALDFNALATNYGKDASASPSPLPLASMNPLPPAAAQTSLFGNSAILAGPVSSRDPGGGIAAQIQLL